MDNNNNNNNNNSRFSNIKIENQILSINRTIFPAHTQFHSKQTKNQFCEIVSLYNNINI